MRRSRQSRKPNFVLIFMDDQGYQDVGCFGSPNIDTPNLDKMAAEGMRFTDFYSASAVCRASVSRFSRIAAFKASSDS